MLSLDARLTVGPGAACADWRPLSSVSLPGGCVGCYRTARRTALARRDRSRGTRRCCRTGLSDGPRSAGGDHPSRLRFAAASGRARRRAAARASAWLEGWSAPVMRAPRRWLAAGIASSALSGTPEGEGGAAVMHSARGSSDVPSGPHRRPRGLDEIVHAGARSRSGHGATPPLVRRRESLYLEKVVVSYKVAT